MKAKPAMPLVVRIWLGFSRFFGFVLRFLAKRAYLAQGSDPARFAERLGSPSAARAEGHWIWVHGASLGEISQTGQLIAELQEKHGFNVVVTTVTQSGADWVEQSLPGVVHQFLPLDTPAAVRGFLDHWSPAMALLVEADIWPRLVMEATARQIPLALLNARPSKSRDRAPKSYRYLLSHFFAVTCKSTEVLAGFRALGIAQDRVHFFGDLRASVPPLPVDSAALADLQTAIAGRPVWIAASSHADDEAEIIQACKQVLAQCADALLIWAPRHPQRAPDIMAASAGMEVQRRSVSEPITDQTQIYLADTFGELGTLFSCSKLVFLGGSFGTQGGHNPYEPAAFGCYMITGPHVRNHQGAFDALIDAGAGEIVLDGAQLGLRVSQILEAGSAQEEGAKARALMATADGAVAQTVGLLVAHLRDVVR